MYSGHVASEQKFEVGGADFQNDLWPFQNRMGHLVSAAVSVKTVGSVALEPTRSLGFATSRE